LTMAKHIDLTDAERAALTALIDGDRSPRRMSPEIQERLSELRLIERREWPNGPHWRTNRGKRAIREGS
jgi:Spy/CpxP family protein refolding chaperone